MYRNRVLLNSRRYDKAIRRCKDWIHRLYTPGTSYIFSYLTSYYLVTLYLKGDIEDYKVDLDRAASESLVSVWDRERENLIFISDNWACLDSAKVVYSTLPQLSS
jgi:hypothetical protein